MRFSISPRTNRDGILSLFFLTIICFVASLPNGVECDQKIIKKNSSLATYREVWISEVFRLAQEAFTLNSSAINSRCVRDYLTYLRHFKNQSIWAVRMFESSEWPDVGILAGMRHHMGNWAECTSVTKGQYCLVRARFDFAFDLSNFTVEEILSDELSAWAAIKMYLKNDNRVDRRVQSWALCVPAACTPEDLESALNATAEPIFTSYGFNVTFEVDKALCSTRTVPRVTTNIQFVKIFFTVLGLLLIGGTIYDVGDRKEAVEKSIWNKLKMVKHVEANQSRSIKELAKELDVSESRLAQIMDEKLRIRKEAHLQKNERETLIAQFLKSFSLVRNTKALIRVKPSDHAPIYCAKFVGMLLITFGHLYIFTLGFPTFNNDYIETEFGKSNISLSRSGMVDLFFGVSGLLTVFYGLQQTKRGGCLFLIFSLIIRWLRMVPIFGVVVLFIVYCLPSLGNGPFWKERILREVDYCSSSWWTIFLAMSNYVQIEKQCLVISWYISVDIQLTVMALIVMFVSVKNKKIGAALVVLLFIGGQAITFAVVYRNKYNGLLKAVMSFLEEPRRSTEFLNLYIQPYIRVAPYVVGMATGFLVHEFKERNYKIPKTKFRIAFLIALLVSEASQWYGVLFYRFGKKYNAVESALFAAFYRWMFVLPYALLGLQHLSCGLEKTLDVLVNRKIWVPLGRLTYSVYLSNNLVELYAAAVQGDLMPSSHPVNIYYWCVATIVYSYAAGLVLYLLVEAPVTNLTRVLTRYLLRKAGVSTQRPLAAKQITATGREMVDVAKCKNQSPPDSPVEEDPSGKTTRHLYGE